MFERLLSAIVLAFAAAAVGAAPATEVRIFAAASLTDALGEAVALFERAHPGLHVVIQFGASSDLARQILAGAPAELFFSADERQLDRLADAGLADARFRRDVLSNRLVVVRGSTETAPFRWPEDLRGSGRIAMGDPEAVPAGVYARGFLEKLGLWEEVRGRVVPTLDVRGALAAVASGNVELGFVYRTDAAIEPRVRIAYEVPPAEGPPILYPLAMLGAKPRDEAEALFRFLQSEEARAVYSRYGFLDAGAARSGESR